MSRKQQKQEVVETKEEITLLDEEIETMVEEPQETEEVIDPRVQAVLNLQRKSNMKEKDKQSKIYEAMSKLIVERK